jgi:hypothetical protein
MKLKNRADHATAVDERSFVLEFTALSVIDQCQHDEQSSGRKFAL